MAEPYVGVDIGGTKMHMIAGSEGAWIEQRVPTGPNMTPDRVRSALHEFIASLPFPVTDVGMTIPGILTPEGDCVEFIDQMMGLSGMSTDYLSGPGFRVHYIGDLPAAALWETSFYPPDQTVLVVMAGTGIAMSGQMGGNPPVMIGADMGYAPVQTPEGVFLLNELVGGYAMLRGTREPIDDYLARLARREPEPTDENGQRRGSIDGETFLKRLAEADPAIIRLVEDAGHYLGLALSSLIVHFFPQVIVVGGGTSGYPGLLDRAIDTARRYTLPFYFDMCRIVTPHGDPRQTAALGARLYAMHKAGAVRPHIKM